MFMRRKEAKKRQRDSQEVKQESFREEVGAGEDSSAIGRWELTSSTHTELTLWPGLCLRS